MKLSIGILTYGYRPHVGTLLRLLAGSGLQFHRTVVFWNACPERKMATRLLGQKCKLITSETNIPVGAAYNRIIRELGPSEWLLRLDDDVLPMPGAVRQLVSFSKKSKAGVVGSVLLNTDGSNQFCGGRILSRPARNAWPLSVLHTNERKEEHAWVSGAVMLIKPEARALVGRFSEEYSMWFEDVDYCLRVRSHGKPIAMCPSSEFIHLSNSKSLARLPKIQRALRTFKQHWYSEGPRRGLLELKDSPDE